MTGKSTEPEVDRRTQSEVNLLAGFRLGEWQVYPELNRLIANDEVHTLEGKVMAVLVELAQSPTVVVTKNALLDAVWTNQTVAEGVLTRAVYELRRVLHDDASDARYIDTVPRRGYRLVCEPQVIDISRRKKRTRLPMWSIAAALTVFAVVLWALFDSRDDSPPITSVAVMPFANLTGSSANDYIGDGLAEAVIHGIAQQPNMGVTARTSSFALRDLGMTAVEVGARLGVSRIIEGSIREERGVQRITIQLIDVSTGLHDSSVALDVIDGDLFGAQRRISAAVEDMLAKAGASIVSNTASQAPVAAERAYDLFLKGRAALHNRSAESLRNASEYFQAALELDPQFAAAHAGLAQFYLVSHAYFQLDLSRTQVLAIDASDAALAIDPNSVDALMVAAALATDNGDYEESILKFQQAVELQPSNAQAQQWYGEALIIIGFLSLGREKIEIALRLNPLAGSTNSVRAKAATFFLDDNQLLETGNQGRALGALLAPRELAVHYFRVGDSVEFGRALTQYHAVVGVDEAAAQLLASAMAGEISRIELLESLAPLGIPRDNFFAREMALLGLHEAALDGLLQGSASSGNFLSDVWLPEFNGVRALPEFIQFIESLGLDQYWKTHGPPDLCQPPSPEPFCQHFAD